MHHCTALKGTLVSLALITALFFGSMPLGAQSVENGLDRPHFALGYVANAPHLMGGVSGYVLTDYLWGFGLYMDVKIDLETPAGHAAFESGLTATDVVNGIPGADFVRRELGYQAFNLGVAKALSPELIVYVGGGLVRVEEYHLYEEPSSEDLGLSGVFWVAAPSYDQTRSNFMLGAFLRLSSFLSSQIGFESEPKGFTIGVSLRLPR